MSKDPQANGAQRLSGSRLFLLAGLAALGSLATNIILPAFPQMADDLSVSARDMGLTLSSFFIAFAVGQLFVGPLSDRFGRKWLVIGGLVVFILGSIVCAFAPTLEIMISGRIFQALGACAASVLARAIARDLFDGEELTRALALVMVAMAAAPGFSPLVGSTMNSLLGWQLIFGFVGVFAVVLAIHYLSSIGETLVSDQRVVSPISSVLIAYGKLAVDRRFILPAMACSLVIGALYTFFATAPSILISEIGLTGFQLSLFFAGTVVVVFSAGFLAPKFALRWGQRKAAFGGCMIALFGSIILMVFSGHPGLLTITFSLCVFLFGMGLINPLGTAITLHPFGSQAGLASALLGFMQMAFAALGSTLASILPMEPTISLAAVLIAATLLAVIAFFPVLRLGEKAPSAA